MLGKIKIKFGSRKVTHNICPIELDAHLVYRYHSQSEIFLKNKGFIIYIQDCFYKIKIHYIRILN